MRQREKNLEGRLPVAKRQTEKTQMDTLDEEKKKRRWPPTLDKATKRKNLDRQLAS